MRKITIIISDEKTETSVRGEITLDMINNIYVTYGLSGLTDITKQLNDELSKGLGVHEDFLPQ